MSAPGRELPPGVLAWEDVAPGYAEYWLPRFRPFLAAALRAFAPGPGPLLVPGCGPGHEALALARRFPDRRVLATDPAPAMLARLQAALAAPGAPPNREAALAEAADARALDGPAGGVLSTFTLQLLPRREATLAAWARALHPAGRVVVLFWPRQPEASAWGRLGLASEAESGEPRPSWEPALQAALPRLGLELLEARDVARAIAHPSPEAAFERLVDACSLRGLLVRQGPQVIARVRARWLADHGLVRRGQAWLQRPVARLWVLARDPQARRVAAATRCVS